VTAGLMYAEWLDSPATTAALGVPPDADLPTVHLMLHTTAERLCVDVAALVRHAGAFFVQAPAVTLYRAPGIDGVRPGISEGSCRAQVAKPPRESVADGARLFFSLLLLSGCDFVAGLYGWPAHKLLTRVRKEYGCGAPTYFLARVPVTLTGDPQAGPRYTYVPRYCAFTGLWKRLGAPRIRGTPKPAAVRLSAKDRRAGPALAACQAWTGIYNRFMWAALYVQSANNPATVAGRRAACFRAPDPLVLWPGVAKLPVYGWACVAGRVEVCWSGRVIPAIRAMRAAARASPRAAPWVEGRCICFPVA
jgi:hypothetical protein